MASGDTLAQKSEDVVKDRLWAWQPPLPLTGVPVFVWPPRILEGLKFLVSWAFLGSIIIPFGALAIGTWTFLQPALERCAEFEAGCTFIFTYSSCKARTESSTLATWSETTPDFLATTRSGTICSGRWRAA